MANKNKYREYFDINESYFPCIDEAAIDAGAPWDNTYPHKTFITLLTEMERALARQNNGKTLWIEGAYGTGKSQCAYALRKILEVPEEELRDYWGKYEPLEKKTDLLEKLVGHKKKGIVVAYRYASGGIMTPKELFFAIQESVKSALEHNNVKDHGEYTVKESIIAWLEDPDHKLMFDSLLQNPNKEWRGLFAQSTTDEILVSLRKEKEVKSLVDNIFRLAESEGITALTINSDRLIRWLSDIIDRNNIRLVLIWDEFSDYFRYNRESLSEFQKIVALVQNKPFYFIVVTHEPQQIYVAEIDRGNQVKVSDRFVSIPIDLPDNIAFDLIGHAFNVKSAAKQQWDNLADDFNSRVINSRSKVMEAAKIDNQQVMKDIMPLHPMAALLLKNIASSFKSNQRSVFDFIKSSNNDDVKAFQWFIENTGPFDNHPLLTVDMLWNFFYEKGRDNLTPDIRLILDTFPQQQNLREDEKAVLKAILIMQAVDQRLGGTIDLFKATEQNLSYVFEGIPDLEGTRSANLAKGLKDKGILITHPISGDRKIYTAAVLAGDQAKIDKFKEEVRNSSITSKLVAEGGLSTVLSLSPALRLRFESEKETGKIIPVTISDFTRTINGLRDRDHKGWKSYAVIAFAKDDAETVAFRKTIKAAVADKQYENIIFIDALSTPLGAESFEEYVDFSAMARYYQGNNNITSRENEDKAKRVLDQDWKNRIYNGQLIVYTYDNQEGRKLGNAQDVASVLQTIITTKFPYTFDFAKNLTESQFKMTSMKQSAKCGLTQNTKGVVVGLEKRILPDVWKVNKYWENPVKASLPISKIKVDIDKIIKDAFESEGQISIGEIYDFLEETYGFAPCNLSSFITGFLLKEYGGEPFRYSDSSGGHGEMTQDKLAEMIGNYIGKSPKATYIVKMTPEEMAFYEVTEKAWDIAPNSCLSAGQAAIAVSQKMRELSLPVWCLEEIDTAGIFDVVQYYIELVQKEGSEAHQKAVKIGKIASAKPTLADSLFDLFTREKCQEGMREFLKIFEGGKVMEVAETIGAENNVLTDIRRIFEVKHSCFWDKNTGMDEIRKLLTEYNVVKESNAILNTMANSLEGAYSEWRVRLGFISISCEALQARHPALVRVLEILLKIYKKEDILPEQLNLFYSELEAHRMEIREMLNYERRIFAEVYEPYLEDLSDDDITDIKSKLPTGLFMFSNTDCNIKVKEAVEVFRKNQLKIQLFNLWKSKTGTKNPREWSNRYRTPILCCITEAEFENAKKAFETLNRNWGTDAEIKAALAFLETAALFDVLSDEDKRNAAFKRDIIGEYSILLPDLDNVRFALERLSIDTYDWRGNPSVKGKVKQLAEAEYNAGGSNKVLSIIDQMGDAQLKHYLKQLVKNRIMVGIEILMNGGRQ
ncbi:MAG: hypothetical protein GX364_04445 [Firmicutes bacterium]|jgi:hypothetical protein|nr:hypothetical protein [Bacillota bacterium]